MATTFIPLISGGQTGPLGFAHLPRFWLKMRAHDAGVLAEGYRHGVGGSDGGLLDTLGIALGDFAGFIAAEKPDYVQCEAWIRAHAADCSPETARTFTRDTVEFEMPDPRLSEWTARFGLPAGMYTRAVGLNQLDDWDLFHRQLLAGDVPPPVSVPGIGSSVAGPLGALHLPRLWLKIRLHAAGRLAEGYRHGVGGFDEIVTNGLGIDRDAFVNFIETAQPDYLRTEKWIREHSRDLTADAIVTLNATIATMKMSPEGAARRRAEIGPAADGLELGIPLNDLDDWAGLDRELKAMALA